MSLFNCYLLFCTVFPPDRVLDLYIIIVHDASVIKNVYFLFVFCCTLTSKMTLVTITRFLKIYKIANIPIKSSLVSKCCPLGKSQRK